MLLVMAMPWEDDLKLKDIIIDTEHRSKAEMSAIFEFLMVSAVSSDICSFPKKMVDKMLKN